MTTGVEGLREESAEALAEGRVREDFLDNPLDFIRGVDLEEDEVERFVRMQKDLDLSPSGFDELSPVYTIGYNGGKQIDPREFEDRAAEDFLDFWGSEIGSHSNVDLQYADSVLRGGDGSAKEVRERFDLQPHSEEALENGDDPVYDAVVEELVQTLYGQAINRDDGFKRDVEAFERVMKNYNPSQYQEIVDNNHTYTVEHLTEVDEMMEAAEASGSCMSSAAHYFEDYAEDSQSLILAARKDGETMGYIRNFLMKDELGNEFLAVDTIEIDHKNFRDNEDIVRAAGMASIQMMYDLEADYLVGKDSRIRYGLRQSYSNTEKSVTGEKLGDRGIRSYTFRPRGEKGKSAYMLMENPG